MAPTSASAAGAGDGDPSPVKRQADPKLSNTSPTDAQCPKVPMAGMPCVSRSREPITTSTRNPRNATAAGVRTPSDTESTASA